MIILFIVTTVVFVILFVWQYKLNVANKLSSIATVTKLEEAERQLNSFTEKEREFVGLNRELEQELNDLSVKCGKLETTLQEKDKANAETLKNLAEAKESMTHEFKNLAQKIFEEKSEKFVEVNKSKIDLVISPFKEQLKDFAKKIDDTYDKESKERVSLVEQINQLQSLNKKMSDEANNLTKALKGDNKTQGNWGELILERILEESGLTEGREFQREVSFTDSDNKRLRPDVIVHLPEGKDVIIDSKVTLVAYERYCSATSEAEQTAALSEHVAAVKNHVKQLSAKSYEDIDGVKTLDYVLLFMPIEAAFRTLIENDEKAYLDASRQKILIVSPSTLLITLRTIASIWKYEYQNRNVLEIAKKAGTLYDKFVGFVTDMEKINKSLTTAQTTYDAAFNKLKSGKGNLVRSCEQLKELGIKHKKTLSAELVDSSDEQLLL